MEHEMEIGLIYRNVGPIIQCLRGSGMCYIVVGEVLGVTIQASRLPVQRFRLPRPLKSNIP